MREVIVQRWCDRCEARGDHTPAETTPPILVVGNNRTVKTLELCPACRAEVLEPLVELLAEYGAEPDRPAMPVKGTAKAKAAVNPAAYMPAAEQPPENQATCPICRNVFVRAYLTGHLRGQHGAAVEQPTRCPDCGEVRDDRTIMIRHRVNSHGYDYIAALAASVHPPQGKRPRRAS